MMAQFLGIKEGYPDAILFYRMGDFYEMFFDDAVQAAQALDITLTKRGKHLGKDIPMCGVPVHSAERYFLTLIRKGFRVAVCEQMENPAEAKKRGSKSVVMRDVVRLVTPGTLTEDSLLESRKNNYLSAYAEVRDEAAFAWADVSTGELYVEILARVSLGPALARIMPSEVLISPSLEGELRELVEDTGASLTTLSRASFDSSNASNRLCTLFGVKSLDGFGQFTLAGLSALGAIVEYLDITQKGKLPLLQPPLHEVGGSVMQIDAATRRNLELTNSLSGGREGSLLAVIDRTITGPGGRLLAQRLNSPSTVIKTINARLDGVTYLLENQPLCETLRGELRKTPDMARALSRLALERGGPRDLGAIRSGLAQARVVQALSSDQELPSDLRSSFQNFSGFDDLTNLLARALKAELPLLSRDGGFVSEGFDRELDDMRALRDDGRSVIVAMQSDYAKCANVNALKIKHNNVLGYFIETPSSHAERMLNPPLSDIFIHRQTTANAVRFTTVELSALETKILNAGGRALEIEARVFETLRQAVLDLADKITAAAHAFASFDLTGSLADLARGEGWCRPVLSDDQRFEITAGRHPVVENALKRAGGVVFIANDCDLTPDRPETACAWLLTGPNMAGKSTFLRQNALIALLAQMGSYVPATSAHIGIVTQLFSRVGASDDLARGRSTFMVEMVETAAILNQAGPGALVILDEIGRGTATYDGLSIAWATMEHLHDANRCRTLFATHYHELTVLSSRLSGVSNATVSVKEWDGDIVFLHEVQKGAADRSYGVQVAKLAGLPKAVTERARVVLDMLEKGEQEGRAATLIDDLPLFSAAPATASAASTASEVEAMLTTILPDELTPLEALSALYELKGLLGEN
ncbi:MAG: DNA mismatch repair protein MutS [Alphaproteobacteria bacterium]|nr:DNA mismatch repair protein MutS [Alphaproteobacteria bacterium]